MVKEVLTAKWLISPLLLALGFFLALTINKVFADDNRITATETQVKDFNRRFDAVDKRLDKVDEKQDVTNARLSNIEQLLRKR